MFSQQVTQRIALLMAAVVIIFASTEDERNPDWRKIAVSGRIVEPYLVERTEEDNGMYTVYILDNGVWPCLKIF